MALPNSVNWWERSPNGSNSNNFCYVNNNGNANNNNATNSYGVAPFGYIGLDRKVTRVKLRPFC